MLLTITAFYAGLLGLWYLVLTFKVVRGRFKTQTSLGDGDNPTMTRAIRSHANFSEYVPLILVMMGLLELGGTLPPWALHELGLTLLVARVLHGVALSFTERWVRGRMLGALLTFLTLAAASLLCVWRGAAMLLLQG